MTVNESILKMFQVDGDPGKFNKIEKFKTDKFFIRKSLIF